MSKIVTTYEWFPYEDDDNLSVYFDIVFDFFPGTPDVHYLSNGDPGYPGDPPEADLISFHCMSICNGNQEHDADKVEQIFYEDRFSQEVLDTDAFYHWMISRGFQEIDSYE